MKLTLRKAHVLAKQLAQYAQNASGYETIDHRGFQIVSAGATLEDIQQGAEITAAKFDTKRINISKVLDIHHVIRGLIGKQNATATLVEGGPSVNELLTLKAQAESTIRLYDDYSHPNDTIINDDVVLASVVGNGGQVATVSLAQCSAGVDLHNEFNRRYMVAKKLQAEVVDSLTALNNTITVDLTDFADAVEEAKQIAGIV